MKTQILCKKWLQLALFLTLITRNDFIMAQQNYCGEYNLQGMQEMASGIRLNADSTFNFFYYYGASDRSATGTWTIENNKIILEGNKPEGIDFSVVSRHKSGNGFSITVLHDNHLLLRGVACRFIGSKDSVYAETNEKGIAFADLPDCHKILLMHTIFPDFPGEIIPGQDNNFEVSINQSLAEVVFKHTILDIDQEGFTLSNIYLFGNRPVHFVKQ